MCFQLEYLLGSLCDCDYPRTTLHDMTFVESQLSKYKPKLKDYHGFVSKLSLFLSYLTVVCPDSSLYLPQAKGLKNNNTVMTGACMKVLEYICI